LGREAEIQQELSISVNFKVKVATMRRILFIFIFAAFFSGAVCGNSFAERPAAGSPVSSDPTVPVSRGVQGTVDINYNINSSNLIVTGNVAGDKHFRGIIPYRSIYELDVDLGSDSLNSFIRRSAGTPYANQYSGSVEPYYLPSKTVTSIQRGRQSGLEAPQITFSGTADSFSRPALPEIESFDIYRQQRPLSMSLEEINAMIARQIERENIRFPDSETTYTEDDFQESEDLEIEEPDSLLDEKKETEDKLFDDLFELAKPDEPDKPTADELMSEQLEEETEDFLDQPEDTLDKPEVEDDQEEAESEEQEVNKYKLKLPEPPEHPEVDKTEAKRLLGKHKTFKSLARTKFDQYLYVAEELMKKGKFYRAADAYTLAGVWDSRDARPYIGKSHALFAAGEYMSSAYFLDRGITLNPEYAEKIVDLGEMFGDKDMIENRIIEILQWQQRSNSGELAFLAAYIAYQIDNVPVAKQSIGIAAEKMGDRPAVVALKKIIDALEDELLF